MEKLSYKLAEFEGPLDLLLHLIAKHKLNIQDIEISLLFEQYMEYIHQLQENNLEIASEFLEMASRLIYIKTVSLLPRYEGEEEEAKAELVGQLVEYSACKRAAALLAERSENYGVFVRSPMELEIDQTYRLKHPVSELLASYLDAVGRGRRRLPPRPAVFEPLVARPVVSVTSRIIYLMRRLYKGKQIWLDHLLTESAEGRSQLVATFLAVLELVKSKRVTIEDDSQRLIFHGRGETPTA